MNKLVVLKVGEGTLQTGFPVILQIGQEGSAPTIEIPGYFPSVLDLWEQYQRWQVSYRQLGSAYRLEAKEGYVTNVSIVGDCHEVAQSFCDRFNQWFQSNPIRTVREKLLEQLDPADSIRVILQTHNPNLRRLPWHLLDFFDRYPQAEVALSTTAFESAAQTPMRGDTIRVLAILGHAQGLDIDHDQALLNQLPHADIHFLVEPSYQVLNQTLWDERGWDILFFAGHSSSQQVLRSESLLGEFMPSEPTQEDGCIALNPAETLSIKELHHALKKARQRGLNLAIFNSCDGLGLAQGLTELNIPQILVMREPIPDQIAHAFLKSFLESFAQGTPFYLAVREAREQLQGWERQFPCATWLPVICQNPAEVPPTWQMLYNRRQHRQYAPVGQPNGGDDSDNAWGARRRELSLKHRAIATGLISSGVAAIVMAVRFLGGLQGWELKGYDWLLQHRPLESTDRRIVVIETGPDHVDTSVTLSNAALNQLLVALDGYQPRLIGLDLYRDFEIPPEQGALADRFATADNLISICRGSDDTLGTQGIAPAPDFPAGRIGFSDYLSDDDAVLRRQLVVMTPGISSPCQSPYAFSTLMALNYLQTEHNLGVTWTEDQLLQVGDRIVQPLGDRAGPYNGKRGHVGDTSAGYQLLFNYRHLSSLRDIADTVTVDQILTRSLPPDALKNKIVLIGRTDTDTHDVHPTPYGDPNALASQVPGVMIHAHMMSSLISTILDHRPMLTTWPEWGEISWILLWAGVGGGLSALHGISPQAHGRAKLTLALMLSEASLWGICWWVWVHQSLWVPFIPPAIALAAIILIAEGYAGQPI